MFALLAQARRQENTKLATKSKKFFRAMADWR
jgi:hypothetical protein